MAGNGSAGRAVLRAGGGAARELGVLGGRASSEAIDINARGDIVGYSATDDGARRASLWAASGAPQDLGTLAGGTDSEALAINAGTIVGRLHQQRRRARVPMAHRQSAAGPER